MTNEVLVIHLKLLWPVDLNLWLSQQHMMNGSLIKPASFLPLPFVSFEPVRQGNQRDEDTIYYY